MTAVEPPSLVNPDAIRRAPDGRIALHFPDGQRSAPEPFWLGIGIRGDLYVELFNDQDVAGWEEVPLP